MYQYNFLNKPLWLWVVFSVIVSVLLLFDLGVLHKKAHKPRFFESLTLSGFYISVAIAYGAFITFWLGAESGKEYFTGFLIEKTLSLDNIFVMYLIFSYFKIPSEYQHRVLFWGILGVVFLRGVMIFLGAALILNFHWLLYLFAVFLIFSGVQMLISKSAHQDIGDNRFLKLIKHHFPVTERLYGQSFFIREGGRLLITPLMMSLMLIEISDLIFAVDSVPAIFSITKDPFVVYTSNIFAILGLRALYFVLASVLHKFKYLKPALALVLLFVGSKIFITDLLGLEKFPASISLGVTLTLLMGGVGLSIKTRKN